MSTVNCSCGYFITCRHALSAYHTSLPYTGNCSYIASIQHIHVHKKTRSSSEPRVFTIR
ncbi:hypothetical protein [Endozoicomonas elysicola]|uniref:hypothetical protein n=1 Tax=Endozoicomonas elysicola TaxID=305900 RepID=UPI001268B437